MSPHLKTGIVGGLLGFSLSRIGFSDFGEVHRMFVFADLRLLFTFLCAVALSMVGYRWLARETLPARPIHPGSVPGGVLFGVGWAITGACPAVSLVQLGEGKLPALLTLAGVLFGTFLYPTLHGRFFRWDSGSCGV